ASAGVRSLVVEARAPAGVLRQCLAALPGLGDAMVEDLGDGIASLRAEVAGGADPREAAAAALAARGLQPRQLRLQVPTLEEFFYAVTEWADRREELAAAGGDGSDGGATVAAVPEGAR